MRIAILGTKGIPNNYGGYEQFAEYISEKLVERGHDVTVYNPSFHSFEGNDLNGVSIIRKYSPEKLIGGAANFIYDFLCLRDALKRDFDIIYEAGYHSVAISLLILRVRGRRRPVIITNMDGLEYKRSKWNRMTQWLIRWLEKVAVRESHYMISDNLGIKQYYKMKFDKDSFYIPYGADPIDHFNMRYLSIYNLVKFEYCMVVARLEPENNIEMTLDGFLASTLGKTFIVVGNHATPYGRFLRKKYESEKIRFVGGIYGKKELDSLRHYSLAYFHGHSVGGTNPSLLEAMACGSFIIAHHNVFNQSVLGDCAIYFKNKEDVTRVLDDITGIRARHLEEFTSSNRNKTKDDYNWENIVTRHEELFRELIGR
jgi:glycosyltransferase involved in cell wall biosynthesis